MRSLKLFQISLLPVCLVSSAGHGQAPTGDRQADPGLALQVELLEKEPGRVPRAIRLTVKNASRTPLSFEEPSPMDSGPGKQTLLSLKLLDSRGRESYWDPVLTEHFKVNLTDPATRTLAPGESWSQDYDLDRLYFWGPCGPGMPISEFLLPGQDGIQLQARVHLRPGSPLLSPPIPIPYKVASWIFEEPGSSRSKDNADSNRSDAEAAMARERQRLRTRALQALRKTVSSGGKEPEHAGKPVSHWLERFISDPESLWVDDDDPRAAARLEARDAVLTIGASAVPILMAALEIDYDLQNGAVDLLRELFEAGKVLDHIFVQALRSGSEQARMGVVEALDTEEYDLPNRRKAAALAPDLIAALVELLRNPSQDPFLSRENAASALGRPGLKGAVPALIEALQDRDGQVRYCAAQALAAIGPEAREAIPALKSLARAASQEHVRRTARSALRALGEKVSNFADFFERMEEYFYEQLAKAPVKERTEAQLDPSFPGATGVFFVVDRSGSSLQGFRLAQRYIPRVLVSLGEEAEFGIVFVDRRAESHPEGGKPAKADRAEKADALGFVLRAQRGSGSCPGDGFDAALAFAEASRAQRKVIFYIGDGGGTCSGSSEADELERLCEEVTRKNAGRVEIHALGVDAGPGGEAVLFYLTERNGGTYTRLVKE